nr:MAG TPA: hypothetical protein [Caudoviricetes sp.]
MLLLKKGCSNEPPNFITSLKIQFCTLTHS